MKIALLTLGSRGDVQPYAILGQTLKQQGHQVTLSTAKNFETLVRSYRINFRPVDVNSRNVIGMLRPLWSYQCRILHFTVLHCQMCVCTTAAMELSRYCNGFSGVVMFRHHHVFDPSRLFQYSIC
ncbi:MAG: glycosyltransferase [Flavisolibacter sp.]|nr:glycosyltransferase [Flavisolibacter sp.]MBD0368774.1 glycosyltransferase [Flavisolibacter sp.]